MSRQTADAIINNGCLEQVSRSLPPGRLRVQLVYDSEQAADTHEASRLLGETAGVYPSVDVRKVAQSLREEWER